MVLSHDRCLCAFAALFLDSETLAGWAFNKWVAENRGAFGRWFARWLPWRDVPRLPGKIAQSLALVIGLYVLFMNITSVDWRLGFIYPRDGPRSPCGWIRSGALALSKEVDGWLIIPGLTEDGRLVNVFQPGREQKRSTILPLAEVRYRSHYGGWLCRQWNEGVPKGQRLATL